MPIKVLLQTKSPDAEINWTRFKAKVLMEIRLLLSKLTFRNYIYEQKKYFYERAVSIFYTVY